MINKNSIIKEALIQHIAILQNHLENTKAKLANFKKLKDAPKVITYRNMKKSVEKKIKDIVGVLKDYE